MSLTVGARLGPYEIVAPIGAGGMGEVYRARDPRLGRDVAIKVLPPGFSTDPDRLSRFEQEARAAAALNHPNILAVHDIGGIPDPRSPIPDRDSTLYIVSELLEGETLRERLSGGALPVRKAIEYAIQVAHGLAAAHEKGIVHRDLKPDNIFVTADGRVKILDFGLAKLTQPDTALAGATSLPTTPPNTQAGLVLGTMGYMAPEQVRGLTADHRADIFAFGVVLYEMLSGRRAFHGATAMDTMTAILKEDPQDLSTAERHIPPALARIVDRCLEKSPAARFQGASDLAFALDALSAHSGVTAAIAASSVSRRTTRERLAWVGFGACAIALAAALPFVVRHLRETPPPAEVLRFSIAAPKGAPFNLQVVAPFPAISPDGRRLAFLATSSRGSQIRVRSLDSLEARPLPGTEDATLPFWAPDSRQLGFFAGGKLKKIDTTGGPAQTLCDAAGGEGATWSRDGTILFGTSSSGLFQVPDAGGEPTQVTTLDAARKETSHRWPAFLPGGRSFVYLAEPGNVVYFGSLDARDTKRLLAADSRAVYAEPGYLLFVRENTLMAQPFDASRGELHGDALPVAENVRTNSAFGRSAFTVSESGVLAYRTGDSAQVTRLTWFDRSGKPLGTLGEQSDYSGVELSPDGTRAIVSVLEPGQSAADLWIFDVARGLRTRFTFDPAQEYGAVWSPDGSRVIFNSSRKGNLDLYVKPSGGAGNDEPLLDEAANLYPESLSPDGRVLLYSTRTASATGSDVRALPLTGNRKPAAFLQSSFSELASQFSPDGRWVAYASSESGRYEIYVAPFPGPGGRWQISTAGGSFPRWRRDGQEIFYMETLSGATALGISLMSASVSGKSSAFEIGAVKKLFEVTARTIASFPYDVSADGQRFLVNARIGQPDPEPITVIVNWTAGLKK